MEIRECLDGVKEAVAHELHGMRALKGTKRDKFNDIFYLEFDEDETIYYNKFNIAITSNVLFDRMRPFIKENSKVMIIEVPEHEVYLYIYSYFNDGILTEYLH